MTRCIYCIMTQIRWKTVLLPGFLRIVLFLLTVLDLRVSLLFYILPSPPLSQSWSFIQWSGGVTVGCISYLSKWNLGPSGCTSGGTTTTVPGNTPWKGGKLYIIWSCCTFSGNLLWQYDWKWICIYNILSSRSTIDANPLK